MKSILKNHRPEGFSGKGDGHLSRLAGELENCIRKAERNYKSPFLKWDKDRQQIFASLIIEFAEDLHNDIGLWRSIETCNEELFGTPLPLFVKDKSEIRGVFDKKRMKYFIYIMLSELDPDLILPPEHGDLEILAVELESFLEDNFVNVPKDSGIRKYYAQQDDLCWQFKQKLVWTGLNSYLFRDSWSRYVDERNKGKIDIPVIDDFICQENTIWSGLGVGDILVRALGLPENIQNDVRSWYEKLTGLYRVVSARGKILELENIINDTRYKVELDFDVNPFKINHIILGSLVPYGEYYHWSGQQHDFGTASDSRKISEMKAGFIKDLTKIVYRYDKKLLNKAKEALAVQYSDFISFFGDEIAVFNDGLSMAAALQKKDRQKFESLPLKEQQQFMKKWGLKNTYPKMPFPPDILEMKNGIAVFFNRDEGMEIMLHFNDLVSGFKKHGNNLTIDDEGAIRGFITSEAICPGFVHKLVTEYSVKSVQSAFRLNTDHNDLDFLLRRYKGHFFRNRYPSISFAE